MFDSRALIQAWLDVEVALAAAEAEAGVIPASAAERIAARRTRASTPGGVPRAASRPGSTRSSR